MPTEVLSLVERGWQGARQCSLALDAKAIPVIHVIKGSLDAGVRAMIQPYPHIRLLAVPRWSFRVWVWTLMVWGTLRGRLGWILLDHERSLRELSWWCRRFGLTPVVIQEHGRGYDLLVQGTPTSLDELWGRHG